MNELSLYVVDGLVLVSLVFLTAAVAGLWRISGLYNRLHAAGLALWLGLLPLVFAALASGAAFAAKAVLLFLFLLLTTPVSAHVLGHAARARARAPEESDARRG